MGGSKWRQQDEGGGEFEEAIKVIIRDSSPPGQGGTFAVVEVTLWYQVSPNQPESHLDGRQCIFREASNVRKDMKMQKRSPPS